MARRTQKAAAPMPRLRLGEIGTVGLASYGGHIVEECRPELRFPLANRTFRMMSHDATIKSAIALVEMMISRVKWSVDLGIKPSESKKALGQFVHECLFEDIDGGFDAFIREVTSMYTYGFCVNEKVYRRRTYEAGSKYNDNRIGIKKLPVRSQDTIVRWEFSDDGRDLTGLYQGLGVIRGGERYSELSTNGLIYIPRKKFLLFRVDAKRDNPEGNSPLRGCYNAWLFRRQIEEQESIGITRDMNGMPTLYLPPRYMSEDATPNEKAVYEYYKNVIRNIQMNEQSGLILPQQYDPESRQPLFKFELTSTQGGKMYDTDTIIKRWDNKILMVLFADMLKMGQDQVGSYSLAGAKTNIMAMAIEARLKEIQDVINEDLIPQLLALNGYSILDMPKIKFGDLDEVDLDEFSKAIQRMGSVGALELDRDMANVIRESIGVTPKPTDEPVDKTEIMGGDSQAGDGMAAGGLNGASRNASTRDNSAANTA